MNNKSISELNKQINVISTLKHNDLFTDSLFINNDTSIYSNLPEYINHNNYLIKNNIFDDCNEFKSSYYIYINKGIKYNWIRLSELNNTYLKILYQEILLIVIIYQHLNF